LLARAECGEIAAPPPETPTDANRFNGELPALVRTAERLGCETNEPRGGIRIEQLVGVRYPDSEQLFPDDTAKRAFQLDT
jgi:hypothetical protein